MRDQDRKENYPYFHQRVAVPAAVKHNAYAATSGTHLAAPFHFNARRMPIDWRLLHGIDVNSMVSSRSFSNSPSPLSTCVFRLAHHQLSICAMLEVISVGRPLQSAVAEGALSPAEHALAVLAVKHDALLQAWSCTA